MLTCVLIVLLLAVHAQAQMGPQILFPKAPLSVVEGPKEMNYLSLKLDAVRQSLDVNPVAANDKPFYTPPVQMSIRGMIKSFGGVDPVGQNSPFTLNELSSSKILAKHPLKPLGRPAFRNLPSIDQYKGLGGDLKAYPPRGLDFQPLGNKVFEIEDGPYTGFLEMDSNVDEELDLDAIVGHRSQANSVDMDLKQELQSLLSVGSKLKLNDGVKVAQAPANRIDKSKLVKPVFVRALGGAPVEQIRAQESALLEQATAAMEALNSAEAEASQAAVDAEQAQAAWEEKQRVEALAEEKAREAAAVAEISAMEAQLSAAQQQPAGESFLQASAKSQAKADAAAQTEIDALAEAVASDTIQRQSALTSLAINKLKDEIRAAKEKASAEALKPWWETSQGRQQNANNKVMHKQPAAPALLQASARATASAWNPPTPVRADPTAFMRPAAASAYGSVPAPHSSFLATGEAPAAATPAPAALTPTVGAPLAAMNMYANHVPTPNAIKLQKLANPYSFSTADILYPQLRGVQGASGVAGATAAPAKAAAQPAAAPAATTTAGGNTIVINVSAPPAAPAYIPQAPARAPPAAMNAPGMVPVGTGNNPFSLFPNAPAPSRVLSTGAPLPGTPLSDNGSFGSLKV